MDGGDEQIDQLDTEARARLLNAAERQEARRRPLQVSALSGEGIDALLVALEKKLAEKRRTLYLSIEPSDGAGLSWLYRHAEVLSREIQPDGRLALSVRTDPKNAELVKHKYPETTEAIPSG